MTLLERMRRSLEGRKPAATREADELPLDLAARISAASVVERGTDEHGNPRVLFLFGNGGFTYSRESALGWLGRGWPRLTPAQIERALAMLRDRVAAHMRHAARTGLPDPGRRWADWRPLQFPEANQ